MRAGYLSFAQVKVHLVVVGLDGLQVKVSQTVDLQLEGKGRLQMTVDPVLSKLEQSNYTSAEHFLNYFHSKRT